MFVCFSLCGVVVFRNKYENQRPRAKIQAILLWLLPSSQKNNKTQERKCKDEDNGESEANVTWYQYLAIAPGFTDPLVVNCGIMCLEKESMEVYFWCNACSLVLNGTLWGTQQRWQITWQPVVYVETGLPMPFWLYMQYSPNCIQQLFVLCSQKCVAPAADHFPLALWSTCLHNIWSTVQSRVGGL